MNYIGPSAFFCVYKTPFCCLGKLDALGQTQVSLSLGRDHVERNRENQCITILKEGKRLNV